MIKRSYNNKGFGIIEIIIALGIFVIIAISAATLILHAFNATRLGEEETQAMAFTQEGIEAVRSIKNQSWHNLNIGNTDCNGTSIKVIDKSAGYWAWGTTPPNTQTQEKFTRTITISNVCRDNDGNIVEPGTEYDPNIKKVTSEVTWSFTPARNNKVTQTTYIAHWEKGIGPAYCDWSAPVIKGDLDFTGNNAGIKVDAAGDYAYVVRDDTGGVWDFTIIDVSDPSNPTLKGNLSLNGTPTNIEISGNYAYVTSTDNSAELQVIDITDETNPSVEDTLDLAGTTDAMGVYVLGTTAYVVKVGSNSDDEFFIIDASDPNNLSITGSASIGNNNNGGTEVFVSGDYAYIASPDNAKEVKVVDISDPANPSYQSSGGYNISGNTDATTIIGVGDTIIVGAADAYVYFLNSAGAPTLTSIATYQTDDVINDIALGESANSIFEVSNNNVNDEFQAMDIQDLENITLLGAMNSANKLSGVAFDGETCVLYTVGATNTQEFMVITPD